jgi:hypothetical protein
MKRMFVLVLAGLLLAGCQGPEGPSGPTGPRGPAGQDGKDGTPSNITRLTGDVTVAMSRSDYSFILEWPKSAVPFSTIISVSVIYQYRVRETGYESMAILSAHHQWVNGSLFVSLDEISQGWLEILKQENTITRIRYDIFYYHD